MSIAIMQPYFFPYIGYFQLIQQVDTFIFLDDAQYIKKGWIDRNFIYDGRNRMPIKIHLCKASQNLPINAIELHSCKKWRLKLLKKITLAYKKAKQFEEIFSLFQQVLMTDCEQLAEMAIYSVQAVCDYLGIEKEFLVASEHYKKDLKGEQRIIDICLQTATQQYINAEGGKLLYNADNFHKIGVQLVFQKTKLIEYKQFTDNFIAGLSILDILMHVSKENIVAYYL